MFNIPEGAENGINKIYNALDNETVITKFRERHSLDVQMSLLTDYFGLDKAIDILIEADEGFVAERVIEEGDIY